MTDDEILATLADEESPAANTLVPVVSATEYTVAIPDEDANAITEADKWEHLEGFLYRRKCFRVQTERSEGVVTFAIGVGDTTLEAAMQALQEEIDEITGRNVVEKAGAAWGMF